jgi:hypothetical protein
VLGVVPLLRAEGSEEESQFGLVVPEDVRPSEAKTMILPRTPDESLVVDVARGLDSGSMIEQAHRILMQVFYSVGYHREEGNVEGFVCVYLRYLALALNQGPAPGWCAGLGERVRPRDIEDELAVADDAGEVAVFRELEVDVALFPLGARLPGVDRLVRGDVALVGGGGDAREVAQYAVKLVLKLIMQSYDMASEPACARSATVALVVEPLAAALHGTAFLRDVIRLSGGEAKGRCHQGAPAPLAALALVVEEVGVHADDADPSASRPSSICAQKGESAGRIARCQGPDLVPPSRCSAAAVVPGAGRSPSAP